MSPFQLEDSIFEMKKCRKAQEAKQFPQIVAILAGSLASLSAGLLFSWTSPAIPKIISDNSIYAINLEEASYFTVIPPISMALSSPLLSMLVNTIGPKKGLLWMAVPLLIAWILTGLARNIWIFYLARAFSGIADAAVFATAPTYVCEVSQPKVRGVWGNTVAISIYLGIFLIHVIGTYSNLTTTAFICGIIPIVHVIIFSVMPESPYFLLRKGKEEEARKSLKRLRWLDDVEDELTEMKADVERQKSEQGTMMELFTIDSNRRALTMCFLLRLAQQFSGLSAFEQYTQYIFQQAGGNISHEVSAIIVSGTLALCIAVSAPMVERCGRKPLAIVSCFGCGIALGIVAVYFTIRDYTDWNVSDVSWLPLAGMLSYIVICSVGIGILPTLILGEIFSSSVKGKATSLMNIGLAFQLVAVTKIFQTLAQYCGILAPFWFFASCCFLCGVLSCFYVIETKGKTLEQIQQELKGNKVTVRGSC